MFRSGLFFLVSLVAGQACDAQDIPAPEVPTPQSAQPQTPVSADESSSETIRTNPEKGFDMDGWKRLVPDLASEQKKMWLFPLSAARGRHLKPTVAVIGVTAGLIALDGYSARYFQRKRSEYFTGFNKTFSGPRTGMSTVYVPLALYGIGLARSDVYAQRTFLLAGQAVLTSEILTSVMKDITRRNNPAVIPPGGDFSDTWFKKGARTYIAGAGSFPSGHTIAAFSVATAYAERYPKPGWHAPVAYGLAGLVGFSRVTLESHYVSEVVLGAALGYFIGRYVVHRVD